MDLPDCPPGAEGYEDTVVEVARKVDAEDSTCTKAELEFKEHLSSLKIKVEDGTTRCMVERRGRDISGKWIYLCFPCAAVCSGEPILQTHITGKKHKTKLSGKTVWPVCIFQDHPVIKSEKGENNAAANEKNAAESDRIMVQMMADTVNMHNLDTSKLDEQYCKFRQANCHIQDTFDGLKTPLLGVEYLIEFPPEEAHHEPSYTCLLCNKHGAPRTIVNHMVSFWHRIHFLWRHFPTTHNLLQPYRTHSKYREGVSIVMNRLVHRIEESYGRLKPLCIERDQFNKEKEQITQWVFKGYHFSEKTGKTFEEVVDTDLITSLERSTDSKVIGKEKKKDPSPPVVAAPSRNARPGSRPQQRRLSVDALSEDLSGDEREYHRRNSPRREHFQRRNYRGHHELHKSSRHHPLVGSRSTERRGLSERIMPKKEGRYDLKPKHPNIEHKRMVATDQTRAAEQAAGKILAYHEKNPEKHPLYPEEWKKFWNKRYKELQAEGKDPAKHDFKPEWIIFWTKRMKELHDEELKREIQEIHRRLNFPPPEDHSRRSPARARSPPHKRSPPPRRRSRSPPPRRRSRSPPPLRRRSRSPPLQHHSRSPFHRSRSPVHRSRSPMHRNRSPVHDQRKHPPGQNPYVWRREEHGPPARNSLSPLSLREAKMRKTSETRTLSSNPKPMMPIKDTVLISDDELRVDPHSPWNNSDSLDSLGSLPDAKSPAVSHASSSRGRNLVREASKHPVADTPDDVVSSLRVLVALEDYLGSLGPKLIDLLTLALKMEKETPNSSEQLLENEMSVSLIETTKEKLKGALQAGLVSGGAANAARKAITKAAALLHEADKRQRAKMAEVKKHEDVAVAGVGAVDKAAIAKQMAAALIAQGKTDVTTEELAQLVDAVVGMAEAKKREAEKATLVATLPAPKQTLTATPITALFPSTASAAKTNKPSGSALQLLQSAYDENEKEKDKKVEEAPDVMDGLSDSDLKTLLQNFSELSAEEQHGLIAYLKKLEAKDPGRVERLREYVSSAVSAAPIDVDAPAPVPKPAPVPPSSNMVEKEPHTLAIDSDEDDYTVEEVFKSAAEKVKENQMRQDMEVVTNMFRQEAKPKSPEPDVIEVPVQKKPAAQSAKVESSAANVLALMQASVHSSAQQQTANTVDVSSTKMPAQPILFGDSEQKQPGSVPSQSSVTNLLESLFPNKKNQTPISQNNLNSQPTSQNVQSDWDMPRMNQYGNQGQDLPPRIGQHQQNYGNRNYDPMSDNSGRNPDYGHNITENNLLGANQIPMRANQFTIGGNQDPTMGHSGENQGPGMGHAGGNEGPAIGYSGGIQGPGMGRAGGNQGPVMGHLGGNQGPGMGRARGNEGPAMGHSGGIQGPGMGRAGGNQGPGMGHSGGNQGSGMGRAGVNQGSNMGHSGGNQGPGMGHLGGNQGPGMGHLGGNQGPGMGHLASNPAPMEENPIPRHGYPMNQNFNQGPMAGQQFGGQQDYEQPQEMEYQDNQWGGQYAGGENSSNDYGTDNYTQNFFAEDNYDGRGYPNADFGNGDESYESFQEDQYGSNGAPAPYKENRGRGRGGFGNFRGNNSNRRQIRGRGGRRPQRANFY